MSQFNYVLPSGAEFVVRGPSGATQAEADRIFYEQVAAGSLVGYESGQTLTSINTQITKFELSRLDRGTAGVDSPTTLSVIQGFPVIAGADTPTIISILQGLPVIAGIPNLTNVPLTNPINEGNIVNIRGDDIGPDSVGPLNSYQTQKLLAQISNLVDQESDQISQSKGIGRYGFTAYALEQAGYVKPGTSLRFFAVDPEDFVAVMSSPSVWTGKNGVYSLADLLNDPTLQNRIQVQLMQQGYQELLDSGVITKVPSTAVKISSGQVFTNNGLQNVQALTAASLLGTNLGPLSGVARNALTTNTTLNRLLASANVNLSTIGSGAINNLLAGQTRLGSLSNVNIASLGAGITNQITGSVGALVTNASKFGSQATALWAKSGSLQGISDLASAGIGNLGSTVSKLATGQLTNIAGSLTTNLNGITSNLTNLVPGSLSNLTSSLDVFGKAGSFATNFANPLGNLSNLGGVGNLGGLLAPGGGIGGAITGQLGGLTGALGGLGSFANIGSVGSLFGGGGDLVSGTQVAAGFNNTVNRSTVDAAFARIVGSPKVPLPDYQYPSPLALGPRLDIQQALSFLSNRSDASSRTFGQVVTI